MNCAATAEMTYPPRGTSMSMERTQKAHVSRRHDLEPVGTGHVPDSFFEAKEELENQADKRPHTSAGLRSKSSERVPVQQLNEGVLVKIVKSGDDLLKNTTIFEIKDGLDTFCFPTPSPYMPPRSATFQHSPVSISNDSPRIGVAIGSPSNAPPNWPGWFISDRKQDSQPPSRAPPPPPFHADCSVSGAEQGKKKSSWKRFGDIFRKSSKRAVQDRPLDGTTSTEAGLADTRIVVAPQAEILTLPLAHMTAATASSGPVRTGKSSFLRRSSLSRAGLRPHAHTNCDRGAATCIRAAHESNKGGGTSPSLRINARGPAETATPVDSSSHVHHDISVPEVDTRHHPRNSSAMPQLDLNLPDSQFDRYSIIFEKLLSNNSKPSLLERRQSRLMRQQSDRDTCASHKTEMLPLEISGSWLRRSATSPHLARPLSVHPADQRPASAGNEAIKSTIHHSPQLLQSLTQPSSAIPPLSVAFGRDRRSSTESLAETEFSDFHSDDSRPMTPTSTTTYTDTDSGKRFFEPNEPAWDMVTSKPVKSVPVIEQKPELYPRLVSPDGLDRQEFQVHVARQVSLDYTRSSVSPAMSSKQPLRPRVVELNRNRKSTAGVLVSTANDSEPKAEPSSTLISKRAKSEERPSSQIKQDDVGGLEGGNPRVQSFNLGSSELRI